MADTARWVAHYRAVESERPDGILHDPWARRLAGERGRAIAEALPELSLRWVIPVRAKVYDELILEVLGEGNVDTVLNLAAGLDTRPYRLDVPAALRWLEADSGAILREKTEVLAGERPRCRVERLELELRDPERLRALLDELGQSERRVLVVTEGVLAYLDEPAVRNLSRVLHAAPAVQSWLLEAAMPEVLTRARRAWGKMLEPAGAALKFAPASGLQFFAEFGWHPRRTRSLLEEAQRLRREMRFARIARFVTTHLRGYDAWRNLARYAVMERRGAIPGS